MMVTLMTENGDILNKYGVKCTFNLVSGKIDSDDSRVKFEEFEQLYKGHEIASHTFTHPHLNNLDMGGIAYEVIKDRELLEEKTGKIIQGFAYPFGLSETEGMIDCIRNCGIRYNYYEMMRLKDITNDEINIINGPDEMLIPGLAAGADAGIGTIYNVMLPQYLKIHKYFTEGNVEEARKIQYKVNRIIKCMAKNEVISAVKSMCSLLGFSSGEATYPLRNMQGDGISKLQAE